MAGVDDYVTLTLLASSAFFVALSFGLLFRYREVSQKLVESTDLGKDLWQALEQRMKKQDERILDVMGRLEVIQARLVTSTAAPTLGTHLVGMARPSETPTRPLPGDTEVTKHVAPVEESQQTSQVSHASRSPDEFRLDETQLSAIRLLSANAKSTRQLTDELRRSREHTARIMKELFELGLVKRNDSTKPFVYQLTEEGRRYLSAT
jgi:hypothetical protein